jgi:hypothetical protein
MAAANAPPMPTAINDAGRWDWGGSTATNPRPKNHDSKATPKINKIAAPTARSDRRKQRAPRNGPVNPSSIKSAQQYVSIKAADEFTIKRSANNSPPIKVAADIANATNNAIGHLTNKVIGEFQFIDARLQLEPAPSQNQGNKLMISSKLPT